MPSLRRSILITAQSETETTKEDARRQVWRRLSAQESNPVTALLLGSARDAKTTDATTEGSRA